MKWFRRKKLNRKLGAATRPARNWRKPLLWSAAAVAIGGTSYGAWRYVETSGYEQFRTLEITGPMLHVSAHAVRDALAPQIDAGFVDFDIAEARGALLAMPWVRDAAVRRDWPGVLHVDVIEQQPVATWFGTSLLNDAGEVFIDGAAGFSGVLPDLGGPAGAQQAMIERMGEVSSRLGAIELEVKRLLRTERRAERMWLSNGMELRIGKQAYEERLRRFVRSAWPEIREQSERIAYVDMRYTNGFAVGWKTETDNGA